MPGVKSRSGKLVPFLIPHSSGSDCLPEYGGLGGTGGHSNLPTESEKDGAPSLTLSRLQLLGVGLTYSTQKHHKSLSRLWEHTRQHGEQRWCENWKLIMNDWCVVVSSEQGNWGYTGFTPAVYTLTQPGMKCI